MGGVNKIILVGNLGRDPELKVSPGGVSFCRFSLGVTEKYSGEDKTEWFNCVTFNRLAEVADKYLKKGRQVYIEGRLQTRKYQDKAGQDRQASEVIVGNLTMLGGGQSADRPAARPLDPFGEDEGPAQYVPPGRPPVGGDGQLPEAQGDMPW